MANQKYYILTVVGGAEDMVVRGKFGDPADNDKIAAEVNATLTALIEAREIVGGPYPLKFDGATSIQVASVITHRATHLFAAIAFRDPKMFVEDPEGLEFIVAPKTQFERKLKVRGKLVNGKVVPDPVYVVTVSHSPAYKVGDVIA